MGEIHEYGRLRQSFGASDFSDAVRDAIAQLDVVSAGRGIQVDADVASRTMVLGSAVLLSRLACNMIHNAATFSDPVSPVLVEPIQSGDTATLTVRDRRIGTGEDDRERIFEHFIQVDTGHPHGTGLGAAIVKRVADLHRGTVTVGSQPGAGPVFRVTLLCLVERGDNGDGSAGHGKRGTN